MVLDRESVALIPIVSNLVTGLAERDRELEN